MKRLIFLLTILLSLQAYGSSVLRSEPSLRLYNAMDTFIRENPDAISDFVYDVDRNNRIEFGRRITGRPGVLPEKSDGEFPEELEMLQNAVNAAEKAPRPSGVYLSYIATGGGPQFSMKACAYRMNSGQKVEDFTIDNALSETPGAKGYTESGAFKLTRDEYVCAQYIVERTNLIKSPDLSKLTSLFKSLKSDKNYKIKLTERTVNLKSVRDPKASHWRQAYNLIESHLLAPEYLRIYYNRAKRYILIADKNHNKLYVAAFHHGIFYYGETSGTDLPQDWLDNLK